MAGAGFERRSAQVIAAGRLLLTTLALLAVWVGDSQSVRSITATYALLGGYCAVALALLIATWKNWWLDARLAAPAHLLDIAFVTGLVAFTEGYTSPFFLFFVFMLLSAAIRWGWRETTLTAAVAIALYVTAGVLVADTPEFELPRFIIRGGHLVVVAAILVWFGVHQRSKAGGALAERLERRGYGDSFDRLAAAVRHTAGASSALLLWKDKATRQVTVHRQPKKNLPGAADAAPFLSSQSAPFLYALDTNRVVAKNGHGRLQCERAQAVMDVPSARSLGLSEGLAIPFRTDGGDGALFLEGIESLSVDHLETGRIAAREIADHLRRRALLSAVETSGEARARLALARDLHDDVVQFLAGSTIRLEAMMRRARSGAAIDSEMQQLKRLLLQEQEDLRSYIGVLRSGREANLTQLADDLEDLAVKLGRQWDIECAITTEVADRPISKRLRLDAQQLVREAVANAVRHGKASRVRMHLSAPDNSLLLDFEDNGVGFPAGKATAEGGEDQHPRSLQERVDEAGGILTLATKSNGTSLSITLPMKGTL